MVCCEGLNDLYRDRIEKFSLSNQTKPGITGHYHQINSRVKLDRFYIQNWTFLLDLKIILLTIPATLHYRLSSK